MSKRLLVISLFVGLLVVGLVFQGDAAQQSAQASVPNWGPPDEFLPPQPGVFPDQWINGVDCGTEEGIQVHEYNEDLYIIRQSKCATFEAPFLYLIFGNERALLLDTGSAPQLPLFLTVQDIVRQWVIDHNNGQLVELICSHTHNHADHTGSDIQFIGKPNVTFVSAQQADMEAFYGFTNYPNEFRTIDLGGRVLDIIPTPGHQAASLTFYDRRTDLLLTGDIIYPGHLFIFGPSAWPDFVDSIDRLWAFAQTRPIQWVLGCHIEWTDQLGVPYPYGTAAHPDEHELQLAPSILWRLKQATAEMGNRPFCKVYDEFEIRPVYICGFIG